MHVKFAFLSKSEVSRNLTSSLMEKRLRSLWEQMNLNLDPHSVNYMMLLVLKLTSILACSSLNLNLKTECQLDLLVLVKPTR